MKTRKTLLLIFILLTLWTNAQNPGQNQVFIGVVNASDPDSGQSLTYSITSGNTAKFFSIDPGNGILTVHPSVFATFSGQRVWKLTVTVADNDKKHPLTSVATITVILNKDALNGKIVVPVATGSKQPASYKP